MKGYLVTGLIVLGVSMFCGIIVISIGMGSVFTGLNQAAAPIVCGDRQLQVVQHVRSYRPGETSWSISAYCVDPGTANKQDATILVQFVAGAIYGLGVFVVLSILLAWFSIKNKAAGPEAGKVIPMTPRRKGAAPASRALSGTIDEKLKKLKELHEKNLITDQEFEKKKADILEDL